MTDDLRALDEEISEAREWFVDDLGVWIEPQHEHESICDIWNHYTWGGSGPARWSENEPPPFSSCWQLAGPLLDEMLRSGEVEKWYMDTAPGGGIRVDFLLTFEGEQHITAPTLCELVARAWLAWHRSKA